MAELAMSADIQRMVYPEEVNRQLHVMALARESLQVTDRRFNYCAMLPNNDDDDDDDDDDEM